MAYWLPYIIGPLSLLGTLIFLILMIVQRIGKRDYKTWSILTVCSFIILCVSIGSPNERTNKNSQNKSSISENSQPIDKSNTRGTVEESTKPTKSLSIPKEQSIHILASELLNEYEDNEVAADGKYKDKIIEVSGIVEKISKNIFSTAHVDLKGDRFLHYVSCEFRPEDASSLATLKKGQSIRIKGTVGTYFLGITLKKCSIVKEAK